jgi:hypothetical protein
MAADSCRELWRTQVIRSILKTAATVLLWAAGILFLPVAMFRVYFDPACIVFPILFYAGLRHGLPRARKLRGPLSAPAALLGAELLTFAMGVAYYMSGPGARECGFAPDPRLVPLAARAQCPAAGNAACLDIATNPYGLAAYRDHLLCVSGLNRTTLGWIPLRGGPARAVPLGGGNAQRIVADPQRGLAVLPLWRRPGVILYDLRRERVARHFPTRHAQLVGAERNGDTVYIVGEGQGLYSLDLDARTLTRHPVELRTRRLFDAVADPARGALFLSDWIYGAVYRLDLETMKPQRRRMLWGMAGAMALDAPRCELYVSRLLYARVDVLDCRTLRTVRRLRAGRGAHELALSPDSNSLYVVNYFEGTFMEMDRRTGRRLDSFRVGRQTRALHLDPATGRLFLASRCGVYEVKR